MPSTLTTRVSGGITGELQATQGLFSLAQQISKLFGRDYQSGTTSGKANRLFSASYTIAASGTQDVDLAGVLTDVLGAALTFVNIRAILIKAADANTNNVVVGNDGSAAFVGWFGAATHTLTLKPGDFVIIAGKDGYGVTATTADILQLTNSAAGSSVGVEIVILGTDA